MISTTFWFFSALNKSDYSTQIQYPLEFVYDAEQYVAVSELPDKLPIDVTGGGWDLMTRSFGFGMDPIRIDLSDPSASKYQLTSTLRGDVSSKMTDINLNFILTDTLFYNIQKRIKRRIPIAFDSMSIMVDAGHEVTSPVTIEPQFIELEGPENLVEAFSNPFIVYPGNNSFDEDVDEQFEIPSLGSSLITADIQEVRAVFEVTEFLRVSQMMTYERLNFLDTTITTAPVTIAASFLKDERYANQVVDTLELSLAVDFNELAPADSTVPVKALIQAPYIKGLILSPSRVKLKL